MTASFDAGDRDLLPRLAFSALIATAEKRHFTTNCDTKVSNQKRTSIGSLGKTMRNPRDCKLHCGTML
jgi:hypothetical protein